MDAIVVKRRRPRFSSKELQLLINGVEKRRKIVEGKFSTRVSSSDKRKAWEEICLEVNSVSTLIRTPSEVRKKWVDYKSVTKRRGNFQASDESQNQNQVTHPSQENDQVLSKEKEFPLLIKKEINRFEEETSEGSLDVEVSTSTSNLKEMDDYFHVENEQISTKQETEDTGENSEENNQSIVTAINELIAIQKKQLEISEMNAKNFQKLVDHLTQNSVV